MNNDKRISQAPKIYEALLAGVAAFADENSSLLSEARNGDFLHDRAKRAAKAYQVALDAVRMVTPGDQFRDWARVAPGLHEAAVAFRAGTQGYVFGNPALADAHRLLATALARIGKVAA